MLTQPISSGPVSDTIRKTIIMSVLFEGFWDRWISHGIEPYAVKGLRSRIRTLEQWLAEIEQLALQNEALAQSLYLAGKQSNAEICFRRAGLYYNLMQWIFSETGDQKRNWYEKCIEQFRKADEIVDDRVSYATVEVDGGLCFGRIRVPDHPKGCIVILNPIDSTKEELFTYEMDFARNGWMTVSFDGPGQGETCILHDLKATRQRWADFVHQVVEYSSALNPNLPIYLFGTSSGAAWALQGSSHPKVGKVVSVSPAMANDVPLPEYFAERMSSIHEEGAEFMLPGELTVSCGTPVLLVHGNRDVMVKDEDIYRLYRTLPEGSRLLEYAGEGHCCNYKLEEIRKKAGEWLVGGNENDI